MRGGCNFDVASVLKAHTDPDWRDVRLGSLAAATADSDRVRFLPSKADTNGAGRRVRWAINGLMHCSKSHTGRINLCLAADMNKAQSIPRKPIIRRLKPSSKTILDTRLL